MTLNHPQSAWVKNRYYITDSEISGIRKIQILRAKDRLTDYRYF